MWYNTDTTAIHIQLWRYSWCFIQVNSVDFASIYWLLFVTFSISFVGGQKKKEVAELHALSKSDTYFA